MSTHRIYINPSTLKKIEDIASTLDIPYEEVITRALVFYYKHHCADAQGQKLIIVFEHPNLSVENLISNLWDWEFA